jgi:hypothetical protein
MRLSRPLSVGALAFVALIAVVVLASRSGGERPAVPALAYDSPPQHGTPPSDAEIRAAGGNGAFIAGDRDLLRIRSRRDARAVIGRAAHGSELPVVAKVGDRGFFVGAAGGARVFVLQEHGRGEDEHQHDFAVGDSVALAGQVRRVGDGKPSGLGPKVRTAVQRRGFYVQAETIEPLV